MFAYWIDNSFRNSLFDDTDSSEPTGNQPLDKNNDPAKIPKKCAKAYMKATSIQQSKNRILNKIIDRKIMELYKFGLSLTTINLARNEVYRYVKPDTTDKKTNIMLAAAIYAKANGVTDMGSEDHKGEGATVRQLEAIFGVTRKTISKWAVKFQ